MFQLTQLMFKVYMVQSLYGTKTLVFVSLSSTQIRKVASGLDILPRKQQ